MTVAKMTARHRHIRRGAGSVILDIIIYAVMILVLLACLVPFIYMLCYAGIPAATHLGYYFGYTQKFNKDDIMYQ